MEENTKKTVMIIAIVVCICLAVFITKKTSSKKSAGIEGFAADDMTWMLCRNPDCGKSYEMAKRDFFTQMEEKSVTFTAEDPPLVCEKCGEESLYRADKCAKCGVVFEWNSVSGGSADKCPECGYSKMVEKRKAARAARKAAAEEKATAEE